MALRRISRNQSPDIYVTFEQRPRHAKTSGGVWQITFRNSRRRELLVAPWQVNTVSGAAPHVWLPVRRGRSTPSKQHPRRPTGSAPSTSSRPMPIHLWSKLTTGCRSSLLLATTIAGWATSPIRMTDGAIYCRARADVADADAVQQARDDDRSIFEPVDLRATAIFDCCTS